MEKEGQYNRIFIKPKNKAKILTTVFKSDLCRGHIYLWSYYCKGHELYKEFSNLESFENRIEAVPSKALINNFTKWLLKNLFHKIDGVIFNVRLYIIFRVWRVKLTQSYQKIFLIRNQIIKVISKSVTSVAQSLNFLQSFILLVRVKRSFCN